MERKAANVHVHVESGLKEEAESIFTRLGLSPDEAISIFYKQVCRCHGMPVVVKIPNKETREAMHQVETGEGLVEYKSLDEMRADWDV